jgi:hypothetical protein
LLFILLLALGFQKAKHTLSDLEALDSKLERILQAEDMLMNADPRHLNSLRILPDSWLSTQLDVAPKLKLNASCPRFIAVQTAKQPGIGHRLLNHLTARILAQLHGLTLAYSSLNSGQSNHGAYPDLDVFFGLGEGEYRLEEVRHSFPLASKYFVPLSESPVCSSCLCYHQGAKDQHGCTQPNDWQLHSCLDL